MTSEESVIAAYARTAIEYGGVDILVSNAGIASASPLEDTTLALWNRNQSILATGYFLVGREAFRLMKAQAVGGSMVFIASKNGMVASNQAVAYCAAKAAELGPFLGQLYLESASHEINMGWTPQIVDRPAAQEAPEGGDPGISSVAVEDLLVGGAEDLVALRVRADVHRSDLGDLDEVVQLDAAELEVLAQVVVDGHAALGHLGLHHLGDERHAAAAGGAGLGAGLERADAGGAARHRRAPQKLHAIQVPAAEAPERDGRLHLPRGDRVPLPVPVPALVAGRRGGGSRRGAWQSNL